MKSNASQNTPELQEIPQAPNRTVFWQAVAAGLGIISGLAVLLVLAAVFLGFEIPWLSSATEPEPVTQTEEVAQDDQEEKTTTEEQDADDKVESIDTEFDSLVRLRFESGFGVAETQALECGVPAGLQVYTGSTSSMVIVGEEDRSLFAENELDTVEKIIESATLESTDHTIARIDVFQRFCSRFGIEPLFEITDYELPNVDASRMYLVTQGQDLGGSQLYIDLYGRRGRSLFVISMQLYPETTNQPIKDECLNDFGGDSTQMVMECMVERLQSGDGAKLVAERVEKLTDDYLIIP